MIIYLKLAWRSIWRNKRRTLITISAIVFAVVLAVLMQSFNRGSHEVMIDNMTRHYTGHVQVQDYRYEDEPSLDNSFYYDDELRSRVMQADRNIQKVLPRIETFMLAANGQSTRGAIVFGIDLELEDPYNQIKDRKSEGRFFEEDEQAVVISRRFSERLGLGVGDTLVLIGQGRFAMSASGLFEIVGIMDHPMPDMDSRTVYMPLTAAQEMLSAEGYITSLLIGLDNERHTNSVAASLKENLEDEELVVFTWPELMPELLELLEFDLVGAYLMSYILYIVIAFGFFGTILTMTLERIKEFGILISVGMQRAKLAFTLFLEVLCISLLGVLIGAGLAWLVVYYFHLNPIQLTGEMAETVMDMGWEPVIPMSFAADQFYSQGIIVFIIAMLISLYPIYRILKLNVIKASRS
ncbi:MAG: ABC transporter permease [Chitinophagaceae bacterium]|nr:MAG: ABC transporter permease [Chitinophagaceae bacterium]